ncbi:hypothetical protein [Thermobifida halotolerans]|uniref:hypothetical protein n=1 Tax=Thermobifida halotolerans TaxID=483545 RepID=UPI000EEC5200|nr:hypothetical protein [Thermobifida halotolerans]
MVHGDHGTVVPAAGARRFAAALRKVSADPVVYAELPGAQRSFGAMRSLRFDAAVDAAEMLAARVVRSRGKCFAGPPPPC